MKRKIKVNSNRGNTVLTMPIMLIISLTLIVVFGMFVINMVLPFIWYEKLQNTSYKYMYVIEKYGCLKKNEKNALVTELVNQGFSKEEITVKAPDTPIGYGNIIEFKVTYNYKQKLPSWEGSLKMITKNIPLNINKVIISKL